MPKSFAELEKQEKVLTGDLIDTFRESAYGGAEISDDAVMSLIGRVRLDSTDVGFLIRIADRGARILEEMSEPKKASKYRNVGDYLRSL